MSKPNPPTYWRSLSELADTPEFRAQLEAEYPAEETPAGFSRRRMLQLMGASMVLASASSCRWKEREILPENKRPENRTPGKFERYATAMELGGSVLGLLVTCVDGRPIKVEGNPKHPNSLGATNAYAQASILELYDPDRSRHIIEKTNEGDKVRSWEQFSEFAKKHFEEYRKNGGEGLAFISESSNSPTLISLRDRFLWEFPNARWCLDEPFTFSPYSRDVSKQLSQAEVILCIEDDLFGSNPNAVRYTRDFMKNRILGDSKMKRLYVVESCISATGAMADHRLPLARNVIFQFISDVDQLRSQMADGKHDNENREEIEKRVDSNVQAILDQHKMVDFERDARLGYDAFFRAIARDLYLHPGKTAILVGDRLKEEHVFVFANSCVREFNIGVIAGVDMGKWSDPGPPTFGNNFRRYWDRFFNLQGLAKWILDGKISSLWILGGNPVYHAPVDIKFEKILSEVPTRIHLSQFVNETSKECTWHIPQSHFLESWGDTLTPDGDYSVVQPMIEPLHSGKSAIELLMLALGVASAKPEEEIRKVRKKWVGESNFENRWKQELHDGFASVEIDRAEEDKIDDPFYSCSKPKQLIAEHGNLEITFRASPAVYDGRFANNSWLQEMPDPITRLTWDNVAIFSPATAEKLGVKHEEIVKLKFKGREIEIPAYILPGQADGSVAVTLGYGRTAAGKVGGSTQDDIAPVGVNTYKLRTSDAMYFGVGLTVEPTGKTHPLASVAEHFAINKDSIGEKGRKERLGELVQEMTFEEYRKKSKSKAEQPSPPAPLPKGEENDEEKSLWKEHEYKGHRWGLTVDLSKCVGCGACVVACMAENNVPVVGKERIFKNREMHWMRIDRYFRGDVQNPQIVFQPVMCQQCEMAPCEGVCPVGATSHSKEGLNDMVYNRCVGTRYCANNCPYKVRRFNFFNYHKQYEDPDNEVLKMASNPQVTVRMRGVMEKCTYCVQRIEAAKIEAKNEKRELRDGEIRTACQQVCPAGAIIFGDLNDKESAVSRSLDNRSYQMLGELNTKPRTSYLARIRNPNPELEKLNAAEQGIQHGDAENTEKK